MEENPTLQVGVLSKCKDLSTERVFSLERFIVIFSMSPYVESNCGPIRNSGKYHWNGFQVQMTNKYSFRNDNLFSCRIAWLGSIKKILFRRICSSIPKYIKEKICSCLSASCMEYVHGYFFSWNVYCSRMESSTLFWSSYQETTLCIPWC